MTDFQHELSEILFSETSTEELSAERVVDLAIEIAPKVLEAARKQLMADIWHKESEYPDNRHPYPVLNPDGEMAYAYYDELCGWQFDRDFKHSVNMLWLDIEKILPKKD
jgi:hypothetical protein